MNYKILDITNGTITVQFDFEDEPRVLSSLPLNDKQTLLDRLSEIGLNLKQEANAKVPIKEVSDLIGKSQDVVEVVEKVVE